VHSIRKWLPDGIDVGKVPENRIFRDEGKVQIFCCGNDDLVVKFRNVLQVDHFLKNGKVQGNDEIIFTFGDLREQFPEIKSNPLFVKNTQCLGDDDGRDKEDVLPLFTFLEYLGSLRSQFWVVGKPPQECMRVDYIVHGCLYPGFAIKGAFRKRDVFL